LVGRERCNQQSIYTLFGEAILDWMRIFAGIEYPAIASA
jgi:hypothetical protein